MQPFTSILATCQECPHQYYVPRARFNRGGGRFCSNTCRGISTSKTRGSLRDRLYRRLIIPQDPDACWLWAGTLYENGYGQLCIWDFGEHKTKALLIHRVSWEVHNGPIPPGKLVCHSCDVRYLPKDITYRRCGNPAHLWLGTQKENIQDMMLKGRADFRGSRI